jgi:hypothetical protein
VLIEESNSTSQAVTQTSSVSQSHHDSLTTSSPFDILNELRDKPEQNIHSDDLD